jgi:hypothetical protein
MVPPRVRTDGFVSPCIPTRAIKPPAGADWVHEIKHDGYRLIIRRDGDTVRLFTRHTDARGELVFEHACRMGLEGIVSKRLSKPYQSGRSGHWLTRTARRRRGTGRGIGSIAPAGIDSRGAPSVAGARRRPERIHRSGYADAGLQTDAARGPRLARLRGREA